MNAVGLLFAASTSLLAAGGTPNKITFTEQIAPLLQKHCQSCHRPGEAGPMSLLTYSEVRPWVKSIRQAVLTKKMPPWVADPHFNKFRNDLSLSEKAIQDLVAWADAGAPEGDRSKMPPPRFFADGWNIGKPDVVIEMPNVYQIPAKGVLDIVYIAIPTNFKEDMWIEAAEIKPGNRALTHHVNAFIQPRKPGDARRYPAGVPYTAQPGRVLAPAIIQPASEALVGYVPGYQHKEWEPGQGKLLPAGADVILQLHYTTNGTPGTDATKVGLRLAKGAVSQRIVSAVAKNWDFKIPAGATNHAVYSQVELAQEATLISLHPHMHYRGKDWEYRAIYPTGETQVLLRIPRWDFGWQFNYFLEKPIVLPRGTRIECTAHYDNSTNNPNNPDPTKDVIYGEQSWDEMMSGWMEVAFDRAKDPKTLFVVKKREPIPDTPE